MDDELAVDIIKYLAKEGLLYSKAKVEHNYPHCWRCKTPLIYYAKPSWYIEMTKLKDEKYSMVSRDNTKIVTFDWASALDFNGQAAPYIQYAAVRANSILKRTEAPFPESAQIGRAHV